MSGFRMFLTLAHPVLRWLLYSDLSTNAVSEKLQMSELKAKEKKLSELQNMVAQYDRNIDETLNERLRESKDKMQADFDDRVKFLEEEKDLLAR